MMTSLEFKDSPPSFFQKNFKFFFVAGGAVILAMGSYKDHVSIINPARIFFLSLIPSLMVSLLLFKKIESLSSEKSTWFFQKIITLLLVMVCVQPWVCLSVYGLDRIRVDKSNPSVFIVADKFSSQRGKFASNSNILLKETNCSRPLTCEVIYHPGWLKTDLFPISSKHIGHTECGLFKICQLVIDG